MSENKSKAATCYLFTLGEGKQQTRVKIQKGIFFTFFLLASNESGFAFALQISKTTSIFPTLHINIIIRFLCITRNINFLLSPDKILLRAVNKVRNSSSSPQCETMFSFIDLATLFLSPGTAGYFLKKLLKINRHNKIHVCKLRYHTHIQAWYLGLDGVFPLT